MARRRWRFFAFVENCCREFGEFGSKRKFCFDYKETGKVGLEGTRDKEGGSQYTYQDRLKIQTTENDVLLETCSISKPLYRPCACHGNAITSDSTLRWEEVDRFYHTWHGFITPHAPLLRRRKAQVNVSEHENERASKQRAVQSTAVVSLSFTCFTCGTRVLSSLTFLLICE